MKIEHKIGEEFTYNGFTLTVKTGGDCLECHLYGQKCDDDELECRGELRKDKTRVIFECAEYGNLANTIGQLITIDDDFHFEKIEYLPLTKNLSVSILVNSEKCFILHAVKPTPQEVATDLNEQYERHLNTKTEQNTLK